MDYGDQNMMPVLEEYWLDKSQLTSADEVKVSKVKKVRKITLSFICSKRCCNFAGKKYFERHSEAWHCQKQKNVKPKKNELDWSWSLKKAM